MPNINKRELVKGRISIIFPIYGNFDPERLLIAIKSVKMQKEIEKEIIVCEEGERPLLKNKLSEDIIYVFNQHKITSKLNDFNPGKIRNNAIEISSGEFIYTNDADIVFLNPYFLAKCKKIIESDKSLILYRPKMLRLPIENFNQFKRNVINLGIFKSINELDLTQEFLATTDKIKRNLKVVTKSTTEYLKNFTTSIENFELYKSNLNLRGKEPIIWSEDLHAGGNFFRKKHFEKVGKYCESFINWGCEDSDLQWKFKSLFNLQFFPKIKDFTVLHLDHEKGYFSPKMWKRNEKICKQRKERGIKNVIKGDLKNG